MAPDTETEAYTADRSEVCAVDPKLLEILACPVTKRPLRYDAARQELISDAAGLAFPIRNGVPIMLVDEARQLGDGDGAGARGR